MKMKKLTTFALAAALAIGTFGFSVPAKATEPTTTDYVLTIPATLDVEKAGWNATTGIIANNSTNNFDTSKKLTVTAESTNSWALKSGDNSVGYNLATTTGTYSASAAPASWAFSAAELNETSGTNKAMGIIVEDYSTKPAGEYKDTVTFTAKVETAGPQLHSITLTGPYSNFTLVMEFYEGDTWNDMATKYPDYIKIYSNKYLGFHTDGLIYDKATGNKVSPTDVIDSNKTYEIQ